ncbi:MAG: 1-phosphofructokinase family hexose kinase [Thermoleophilia bacterium]|nr:1-phosphofructokinase family hexose kinase [Thermoleophilia bacterium]
MILTVTLNAALDRTLSVPNFQAGRRHRASDALTLPGGKGVNVARALRNLGQPVIATGLAGGRTGISIIEQLTAEGILNDFVRIADESRTSTAVVDPTSLQQTEINEYGPSVADAELELLMEKLAYLSKGADIVVLAGSLPRDVPADFYGVLVRELARPDLPIVVDVPGPPLRAALAEEPWLVSPNAREAEEVVGNEFSDDEDMVVGAEALCSMGARSALVHDPGGCVARIGGHDGEDAGRTLTARIDVRSDVVSTVGSGDAFLAGFLAGTYDGDEVEQALQRAVASGAASTQLLGAGVVDRADVDALARQVSVEELAAGA